MDTRAPAAGRVNVAPHEIPLARGERLVVDVADDRFRVAYYRPRRGGPGTEREAVSGTSLVDVLALAFQASDAQHEPRTVAAYIRATRWGSNLPPDRGPTI